MRISDYKLADPEIPKISKTQFLKLTPEKQKEYLRLYKTQIIPKLSVLREHHRFYTIHGGRGSGKSTSVAKILLQKMTAEPHTLLCCREIQNSLAESSYQMLVDMIEYQQLEGWIIQKERIYHQNSAPSSRTVGNNILKLFADKLCASSHQTREIFTTDFKLLLACVSLKP